MPLVNFSNLDFDQIKQSIKDYIRSNTNFTDYDFDGSNLSAIIDVLAYNTYISSYNANMVSNEVFIDSATLRENVVSLARNIGYVPRSKTSSIANISFEVDLTESSTTPATITLRKGIVATSASSFGNLNYTFIVPEDITVPVVNDIATFDEIDIYEGTFLTATFTVDTNNVDQRFILNNANIDTSLISVEVYDTSESTTKTIFKLADSLFNVDSNSNVFFIQEIEDQRYELLFGDGVFGTKLENLNYVVVNYIVSNGENGNNINEFSFAGRLVDNSNRVVTQTISALTTNSASTNGQEIESVSSIKKFAPRLYAAQNRAVTAADYETIIPRIYPETESVSAFGGEDLDPPRFGEVFVSIKPINGQFVPSTIKDNLIDTLKKYSVASVKVNILDLKYLYVEYNSNVYYNPNLAPNANFVKSIVSENVVKYSDSSDLNKYGAKFKYSKFLNIIDNSHESITSNITNISMKRILRPLLNQFTEYEICYGNAFHIQDKTGYNIKTSGFKVSGINDTLYISDIPNSDLNTGVVFLFKLDSENQPIKISSNIGTINYTKGEILLSPLNIISTLKFDSQPIIEFSAIPKSNDVIGKQDLYLQLDNNNSTINMIVDQIASGADISGSNYTTSSSYFNGKLVIE